MQLLRDNILPTIIYLSGTVTDMRRGLVRSALVLLSFLIAIYICNAKKSKRWTYPRCVKNCGRVPIPHRSVGPGTQTLYNQCHELTRVIRLLEKHDVTIDRTDSRLSSVTVVVPTHTMFHNLGINHFAISTATGMLEGRVSLNVLMTLRYLYSYRDT